jgi:uncharacterized membrane protein
MSVAAANLSLAAFTLPLEEPIVTEPVPLLAFLAAIVAGIFALARWKPLQGFFRFLPPLIWTYFIPMICSSLGIIPNGSPAYKFMLYTILPIVLVLLLVPADTRSIARLGPKALGMMLFATAGIVAGATLGFTLFSHQLPEEAWRGITTLSGSWIGGSTNMAAVGASIGVFEESALYGKMLAVDTLLAYSWLGILIALVTWETRIDRFLRADNRIIQQLATQLGEVKAARSRPVTLLDFAIMIALGLVVSQICLSLGDQLEAWVAAQEEQTRFFRAISLSQVLSGFGWGILLITAAGVLLSLTPVRRIDDAGATPIGYFGLYFLLTTFGAQADLRNITPDDVWYFAVGIVWILTHITFIFIGLRLLRAPLFLGATASMANIGGTASAPVVAAAFNPSLAPVGLVMAILGGIIGTPVALLIIAKILAAIAGDPGTAAVDPALP